MRLAKDFWSRMWEWDHQARTALKSVLTLNLITVGTQKPETGIEKQTVNMKEEQKDPNKKALYSTAQKIGLFLGPLLFLVTKLFVSFEGMSTEAVSVLAVIFWIATWWITEAIPIPVTSLLPILLFPLLNVMKTGEVTANYGDTLIFLFAGSFMIALSMEKWNLHKRIALSIVSFIGANPSLLILGFMSATAFISMFISNTATTLMMVPISLAVTKHLANSLKDNPEFDTTPGNFPFGTALMLGTAYAATIGGFGSLVGAPANIILAGTVQNLYGIEISFARWLLFGVPIVIILIPLIWLYLTRIAFPMKNIKIPGGREIVKNDLDSLGKMSYEEKVVLTVFSLTGLAWITRTFLLNQFIPNLDDTLIALFAGIILFLIPAKNKTGHILDFETALKLPWGILWLFGGGLALASGISSSGLDQWIGNQLTGIENIPFVLTLALIVTLITVLTEFTSNTATATMVYPIVAVVAVSLGTDPIILMVAANMAATFAYMFPVAAPPNAIVFGTGYVKMSTMAKTGIWLNIFSIILTILVVSYYVPLIFGNLM